MRNVLIRADVLGLFLTFSLIPAAARPLEAQIRADFNGDTYGDLAIGAAGEGGGTVGEGAVHIIYGTSAYGPHALYNELLLPWKPDVPFGSFLEAFGSSLAWGDFDADGFTDLAVGMPGLALSGDWAGYRGAVRVYYGRQHGGLVNADTQFFMGSNQEDFFGTSLAVGRFNDDEYDDLAIGIPQGVPFAGWSDNPGGGEILVMYGGKTRLQLLGADWRSQDSAGIQGATEHLDFFGFSLAAGDFGHGPEDDLAIGVPGENGGQGAVNVIYGSSWGLHHDYSQLFMQGTNGLAGGAEGGDWFGFSLASGDFNLNGKRDLAIGSPREDIGANVDAGVVHVLYGGESGLDSYFGQAFGRDWGALDLTGSAAAYDLFGWSLAAGDFGKDSAADLAIGVPGANHNGTATGGAVNVVYGSFFTRLIVTGNQLWAQTDAGSGDLLGGTENGDLFGYSLTAADVGRGSRADLIVGAPGDAVNGQAEAGAVNVIFSTSAGLSASSNQLWTQDSASSGIAIQSSAERRDYFGLSVGGVNPSLGETVPLP